MSVSPSDEPVIAFERHRADVYAWAYRLLGRHHDALDAAQDVFIRWLAQSRRAPLDNPRTWLRQVTINRAIDLLRARRTAPPLDLDADSRPAPQTLDPLETHELRDAIGQALEQLTDPQRNVLVAKIFDGLTFARIAAELQIAIPTAKTHYLRALAAVRDRLQLNWGPERKQS